jgi:hypothetical protein
VAPAFSTKIKWMVTTNTGVFTFYYPLAELVQVIIFKPDLQFNMGAPVENSRYCGGTFLVLKTKI